MNKIILISGMLLSVSTTFGQSDPSYRQNQFNAMQLNPAQTGSNDRNEINVLTSESWIGIDGAPKTTTASGNFNATNRLGVGFVALNDQIGPVKTNRIGISGAYHLPLNKHWKMSIGLQPDRHFPMFIERQMVSARNTNSVCLYRANLII